MDIVAPRSQMGPVHSITIVSLLNTAMLASAPITETVDTKGVFQLESEFILTSTHAKLITSCVPEQANITDNRNPNNAFVCQLTSTISSSSASSTSLSSAAVSASDSASSVISSAASSIASAGPTPAPASSSASAPASAPSSLAAPAISPVPDQLEAAPAPQAEHTPAPAPSAAPAPAPSSAPAPATSAAPDDDECYGDDFNLYSLLEEILAEIKCIQEDVKALKGEL
jgi:hypothetical protein